jgi:hypothetical protein
MFMALGAGTRIPETLGFGVLGATIGAVVCGVAGNAWSHHTDLGMAVGATLLIGLSQVSLRKAAHAISPAGAARAAPPTPAKPGRKG